MGGALRCALLGPSALLVLSGSRHWGGLAVDIRDWEPSDAEYWGQNTSTGPPYPMPVFDATELSRGTFDALVREGRAFVVRGVGTGHPMSGWDCPFFARDPILGAVEVRREYASASSAPVGPTWIRLADLGAEKPCSLGPGASPYYLGIKDVGGHSPEELAQDPFASSTWTKEALEYVRRNTVVPAFMDPRNEEYLRRTPEFWFSAGSCGGGAKAHVDQHSESTLSLQLSGRKRWRVAPLPPRAAPHVANLYQDGQIYGREEHLHWNILQDVELEPGDAIFFAPGFIHQTDAVGTTCAASVTWQFDWPSPTTYWRNFLPRLRRTPDMVHTWSIWRKLLKGQGAGRGSRGPEEDAAVLEALFDRDGDGRATAAEREQVLELWEELERDAKAKVPALLQKAKLGFTRAIEDAADLKHVKPEVREAVLRWEEEALRLDAEALRTSHEASAGRPTALEARKPGAEL